jgi:hypothetical protein
MNRALVVPAYCEEGRELPLVAILLKGGLEGGRPFGCDDVCGELMPDQCVTDCAPSQADASQGERHTAEAA